MRPIITNPTRIHGTTRHRPGRYGVTTMASPAAIAAWPETKLSPLIWTSPRTLMSRPIDVAGRSRVTDALMAHSTTSFDTTTSTAASASRRRPPNQAAIAMTGATPIAPNCWNTSSTGWRKSGRSLTARKKSASHSGSASVVADHDHAGDEHDQTDGNEHRVDGTAHEGAINSRGLTGHRRCRRPWIIRTPPSERGRNLSSCSAGSGMAVAAIGEGTKWASMARGPFSA